jgi:uncharacterized protein (TIGR03067 family)
VGTHTLAPSADPPAIDLYLDEGQSRDWFKAIYEVKDGTARLCIPGSRSDPRPTDFDSRLGTLIVLRRD